MNGFLLHLLRHAPPSRSGILLGHSDEPALDPAWPTLMEHCRDLAVSTIVASDLQRASLSAQLLAEALDRPLHLDPRWRELHFGAWEGLAPQQVPQEEMERFWASPDAFPPPGGERWSDLRSRVEAAIRDLTEPTLVVAHAGAMRAALSMLTGLDHRGGWALDLPYGALLSIRVWPGERWSGQVVSLRTGALA
ncbi:histidine phosphatase family protein [Novosphingobium sp.]|uniref:histidine phosphatase family protein n=1 Tax=Novosphingobium sp. TaxID=1874826 RepID=UPI002B4707AB|nr:histidine phosphatase family protein [Novosphingobium sp.]HKR93496.1 histidine phosphatase family protein [Novosphingobium sp.]